MNDLKVSTKTIIASSNLNIENMERIYELLPVNTNDNNVSIQTIYYKNEMKGDENCTTKAFRKVKKSFRNAINVVMKIEDNPPKNINFKLSKNGKFQITGCKKEEHAVSAIRAFISYLFIYCRENIGIVRISGKPESFIRVFFQTVMTNVDFNVNYKIDRQKLDELLHTETLYHSLLETSFGYTGVNIKIPIGNEWASYPVPVIEGTDGMFWEIKNIPLNEVSHLTNAVMAKKRFNTFLVFHSGNIIMSGMRQETMEEHYLAFINILHQWKYKIQETIEPIHF